MLKKQINMQEEMNICCFCKSDNSKKKYSTYGLFGSHYYIRHCNNCKAYFLSPRPAKRASEIPEINLKTGNITIDDYQEKMFEAVSLYQVFEHLTEPRETLENISRIIKKDGILVISFPNINSLQSKIFKWRWFHLDPPRHLFFFKPSDFKKS